MARAAYVGLALAALCASPALAAWSPPQRFSPPEHLDVTPARIAFGPTGAADVGFRVWDEDNPANSTAWLTARSASGRVGTPYSVPHSQQILGLAVTGPSLEILTGNSPKGYDCCSVAEVGSLSRVRFSWQTLVRNLSGFTLGSLVPLGGGQLLAAVATSHGVWSAQGQPGHLGATHQLAARGSDPQALAVSAMPDGHSFIAWTAASGQTGAPGPRSILVAEGSSSKAPTGRRTAITLPKGHQIDELAAASTTSAPTFAWVDGWFDARNAYHSEVEVADLSRSPRVRAFGGGLAADVSIAGDGAGDEVLAWKACDRSGVCAVSAAVRRKGGHFTSARQLGAIDGSQAPAVAIGPGGLALLGWIRSGHVYAAVSKPRSSQFGSVREVSSTDYAADLTLALGPKDRGLAVWTQGTYAPALVGAAYRP